MRYQFKACFHQIHSSLLSSLRKKMWPSKHLTCEMMCAIRLTCDKTIWCDFWHAAWMLVCHFAHCPLLTMSFQCACALHFLTKILSMVTNKSWHFQPTISSKREETKISNRKIWTAQEGKCKCWKSGITWGRYPNIRAQKATKLTCQERNYTGKKK